MGRCKHTLVEDFTEVDNKNECASIKNKEYCTRNRVPEEKEYKRRQNRTCQQPTAEDQCLLAKTLPDFVQGISVKDKENEERGNKEGRKAPEMATKEAKG